MTFSIEINLFTVKASFHLSINFQLKNNSNNFWNLVVD